MPFKKGRRTPKKKGWSTIVGQSNFVPPHRKGSCRSFNGRARIDAMYDHNWERYRVRFLRENPECYACKKAAIVVDHLVPHQGDARLFEKLDNHIPLCIPCHNTVTTKFDRNYRAGNPVTEKIKWLNRNRITGDGGNPRRVKVLSHYK